MDIRKVHEGLRSVDAESTYHLGYYEVDFPDGALIFQLHARICGDPNCVCDDLFIQFLAEGTRFEAWYTAYRQWKDAEYKDLNRELVQVFHVVESTDTFRERYNHLMYLRRSQVLRRLGREKQFEVLFPAHLLSNPDELAQGLMGRVPAPDAAPPNAFTSGGPQKTRHAAGALTTQGHSANQPAPAWLPPRFAQQAQASASPNSAQPWSWKLELCGDPECHCEDLFLIAHDNKGEVPIRIQPEGQWVPLPSEPDAQITALYFEKILSGSKDFQELTRFMRGERRLENYSRFKATYEANQDW